VATWFWVKELVAHTPHKIPEVAIPIITAFHREVVAAPTQGDEVHKGTIGFVVIDVVNVQPTS